MSGTLPERAGFACTDCGAAYASLGSDLCLPDQQWRVIAPEGGVLCASCICKRAKAHGATAVLAWIDNLDYREPQA